MKKLIIAVTAFVFALSLFGAAFAAEKVMQKGTIKSMDAAKGSIFFCPSGTKDEISIKADAADLKNFKAGDKVKVQYEKGEMNTLDRISHDRTITVPTGC